MDSNIDCAINEFKRAAIVSTANTLRTLKIEFGIAKPYGNDLRIVGHKHEEREVSATIDELLADGTLQKELIPNLPRQFRFPEPIFARAKGFDETALNYRLAAQLIRRTDVPLVTRSVYFLTEYAHVAHRLFALHESTNSQNTDDLISPLVVQLRLATFLAEYSSVKRYQANISVALSSVMPHLWIDRPSTRRIPFAPLPDEFIGDHPWRSLSPKSMFHFSPTVALSLCVLSVSEAARIARAMLKVGHRTYSHKAYTLKAHVDSRVLAISEYPEEAHLFLASS